VAFNARCLRLLEHHFRDEHGPRSVVSRNASGRASDGATRAAAPRTPPTPREPSTRRWRLSHRCNKGSGRSSGVQPASRDAVIASDRPPCAEPRAARRYDGNQCDLRALQPAADAKRSGRSLLEG
jgi:hypothetical protein